jgi:hypothetical protein
VIWIERSLWRGSGGNLLRESNILLLGISVNEKEVVSGSLIKSGEMINYKKQQRVHGLRSTPGKVH